MINGESKSIIFALFRENDSIFLLFFNICFSHFIWTFGVADLVLRFDDLNGDEAVRDSWVRNALHKVFVNLLEWNHLIIVLEVILQELFDEIST